MSTINQENPTIDVDITPADDWSLEQLGEYCLALQRKTALMVWRAGRALLLAKRKHGKHGDWGTWLEKYCSHWSRPSISRYMRVAKRLTEDQVKGEDVSPMDAYRMAGLALGGKRCRDKEPHVVESPSEKPNSGQKQSSQRASDNSPPSKRTRKSGKIVTRPTASSEPEPDEEDELSPEEDVREHLADIARLFQHFREYIAAFRGKDEALRRTCWQEAECDAIRDQIDGLRAELDWLESEIPQEAVEVGA
jgi:hypothetical protein